MVEIRTARLNKNCIGQFRINGQNMISEMSQKLKTIFSNVHLHNLDNAFCSDSIRKLKI